MIDPRNGNTFYVGKAKNNRVFAYAKGVLDNYEGENYTDSDEDEKSTKIKIIKEIKSSGLNL